MGEKETRILEAADALFGRHGLKKTTIEDIARDAQIGKGTVYLYFKSKEEIFLETQRLRMNTIQQKLRACIRGETSAAKQLKKLYITHLAYIEEHLNERPLNLEILSETQTHPEYQIIRKEAEQAEDLMLRGILEAGVESGEFGDLNIDQVLWMLRHFFIGILAKMVFAGGHPPHLGERISNSIDILLSGLLNKKNS